MINSYTHTSLSTQTDRYTVRFITHFGNSNIIFVILWIYNIMCICEYMCSYVCSIDDKSQRIILLDLAKSIFRLLFPNLLYVFITLYFLFFLRFCFLHSKNLSQIRLCVCYFDPYFFSITNSRFHPFYTTTAKCRIAK